MYIANASLDHEVEAYKNIDPKKFNFDQMSWGQACSFIIVHGEKYRNFLRLATSTNHSNKKFH
mgnify:CR=1 FL=1|tara:strand:- start:55 stop:243 length:189 start_codon:yes stop_codon:yes gene_type:complete